MERSPSRLTLAVVGVLVGLRAGSSDIAFAQAPPAHAQASAPPASEPDATARVTARAGDGVTFHTGDDLFSLNLRVRAQLRGELVEQPDDGQGPAARAYVRRMRLAFKGHAWTKDLTYAVQLSFSTLDQEPDQYNPLRDAYVTYRAHRDFELRAGQMKVPFGKQRVISSSSLAFPDRSIIISELSLDRDVGAQVFSSDLFGLGHTLGYHVGIFGGDGRNRISTRSGVLAVARVVYEPFGEFDDLVEADHDRLSRPRLSIGLGGAFNENTRRPRSVIGEPYEVADFDYLHGAADVMFKWSGFYLLSEFLVRHTKREAFTGDVGGTPVTEYSRSAWGAFAQAGQMFTEHFEVVGRYSRIQPFDTADPSLHLTNELGAGVNFYLSRHDLKLQFDYANVGEKLFGAASRHELRTQFQIFL